MDVLQKIIGSQSRAEILKRLFASGRPTFYLRKLAREAELSAPVIHRELQNMLELELVRQNSDGNRVNFSANPDHPLYPVLCELVKQAENLQAQRTTAPQNEKHS